MRHDSAPVQPARPGPDPGGSHRRGRPAVHVWRHPADPELPGLVVACTPSLLSARIGTQVKATMVAYRPTRRAVVRATFPDETTAYAKVLRPSQAASFAQRHRLLTASGVPAPEVLRETLMAWSCCPPVGAWRCPDCCPRA